MIPDGQDKQLGASASVVSSGLVFVKVGREQLSTEPSKGKSPPGLHPPTLESFEWVFAPFELEWVVMWGKGRKMELHC